MQFVELSEIEISRWIMEMTGRNKILNNLRGAF